ncbi:MAG TPA: cytochrome c maturation protein CcmE [Ktedonobacteraceae bacterium]|nr:cytochrome c maturation protein CcmE [Ktedonobacteraceae bacterium]
MQSAVTVKSDEPEVVPPHKRRLPLSFILAGIAILGAVIYLVYANTQTNAVYYMTVSELKHCTICTTQAVRVAGVVQAGSIVRNDQSDSIRFVINDGHQTLPVTYSGVVPDIFRPGIQVVVEGRYSGQGPFQAQTLLAKCPSRFQSATPAATQ